MWYIFLSLLVLWVSLNIFLPVKTFSYHSLQSASVLFPFNYRSNPGLWAYDFTEFIGYSCVIPYLIYTYMKKQVFFSEKLEKFNSCFLLFMIAYCDFTLSFLIVSDNYDVAFFLLSTIGGLALFLFSKYITEVFLSMFPCFKRKEEWVCGMNNPPKIVLWKMQNQPVLGIYLLRQKSLYNSLPIDWL